MSRKTVPLVDTLRQLVRYEPESGKLFWIERDRERFPTQRACSTWNKKFAGAEAFTTPDGQGYLTGKIFRVRESAHRIAFALVNGRWPTGQIDHINGDRTDNRLSNLREVQPDENGRNCKRRSDNTSGVTGVRLSGGRYIAELQSNRRRVRIGAFDTLEEAAQARKAADRDFGFHENHGRSALVDVPAVYPVAWQPRYKQDVIDHHRSIGGDLWEYAMTVYPTKAQAEGYGYGGHEARPLYTSPPLSLREGEDSAEVLRSALQRISELTPARANAKDARDLHHTVKAIADVALAATRSASATTAKGCAE